MSDQRDRILAERMRRQGLTDSIVRTKDLLDLFRRLQPVSPLAYSYPGSPPRLIHRTSFDDGEALGELRSERTIVKGRFQRGRVGYVHRDDLALYGTAFRKPIKALNETHDRVLEAVREIGPADSDQIKEAVDADGGEPLLKKQIMPALNRMQEAFLVFEDQTETDWVRPWSDFETEWDEVDLDRRSWEEAAGEVIRRFLDAMVFATIEQVVDWTGWAKRRVEKVMRALEADGLVEVVEVKGLGAGFVLEAPSYDPDDRPSCRMIHKGDYLAHAHATELKARYRDQEVLQYLLIDGAFKGVVLGHWRIGPHDVDDVVVELPKKERVARRGEILAEVRKVYSGEHHEVLCYDGKDV